MPAEVATEFDLAQQIADIELYRNVAAGNWLHWKLMLPETGEVLDSVTRRATGSIILDHITRRQVELDHDPSDVFQDTNVALVEVSPSWAAAAAGELQAELESRMALAATGEGE